MAYSLSPLQRGRHDPCMVVSPRTTWWCGRCGEDPFAAKIDVNMSGSQVVVTAWGAGAQSFVQTADVRLGLLDTPKCFDPVVDRVAAWRDALPGVCLTSTGLLVDSLVPAVLEQRVMASDAFGAWSTLVRSVGQPAPLPPGLKPPRPLFVPPTAVEWLRVPSWVWHQARVDPSRSSALMRVLRHAPALERDLAAGDVELVRRRLLSVPGVGVWTVAQVLARVCGDGDAVAWGDYHLGRLVGWGLLGRVVELDEVEPLLEPWRPHRHRLVRYMELTPDCWPPRRGPRLAPEDHRHH